MSDIYVPTLNIREAVILFREAGISTSDSVLGAGIEQGLYPFAICIKTVKQDKKSGNRESRRFEIYAKLLKEYLAERAVPIKEF